MKKGNAGITILIVLLFLTIIGMSIYLLIDKSNGNTNTPPADSQQGNTVKEPEDSYVTFLANAKKIREKYTLKAYAIGSAKPYSVTLDKDGKLYVDDSLLDSSVVSFSILSAGNGGFEHVYYIKEDGSVYSSNSGYAVNANEKVQSQKVNLDKIVSFVQGSTTSASYPIYVDINGNAFDNSL